MSKIIAYAMQFVGRPYHWGGNNSLEGFDCSGFVQELLASVGLDPPGRDTAQTLHNHFIITGELLALPVAGALVFYGKSSATISHVAFSVDSKCVLEAGGGDSTTISDAVALKQGAVVRMRPYNRRGDVAVILMPKYPFEFKEEG